MIDVRKYSWMQRLLKWLFWPRPIVAPIEETVKCVDKQRGGCIGSGYIELGKLKVMHNKLNGAKKITKLKRVK